MSQDYAETVDAENTEDNGDHKNKNIVFAETSPAVEAKKSMFKRYDSRRIYRRAKSMEHSSKERINLRRRTNSTHI